MIRLALVGCGGISKVHAERITQNPDRMKIVACVDIDEDSARNAAEVVGADIVTADFHKVLPEVDALLLALPHFLHHPVSMECMEAGKHVLVEKPMALSEQHCLDMINEAEKRGVTLMIGYVNRYNPLVCKMREVIVNKEYGETFHLSMWTEQHSQWQDGSWHHRKWGIGGGQFNSHGCHYVDLMLWFLGNPVEGIHMGTNFGTPWMEGEGTSDMIMKFESGATGYHFGTWGARGSRHGYAFHAHTTEGMLEAAYHTGELIFHKEGEQTVIFKDDDPGKHMGRQMTHFLDCIERNEQPITSGRVALQSLRAIWRMYEAEQSGTVADLRGLGLNEPMQPTE